MFILGILLYITNTSDRHLEEENLDSEISIENESNEKDQTENQASSSIESNIDSSDSTDNTIMQNEIIEVPEPEEMTYENTNISVGILSLTGIFLLFSIIFTIIFIKRQQNAHKNVSK